MKNPNVPRESAEGRDQIVLTPTQARQGATPHGARYVLVGGMSLVILIFAVLYLTLR